ncbi:MAG: DUF3179 domain-containing protein [Nitrospira sp.]|nr:DUF3179 domain-containing protein [bacterium]MBL7048335.1 DUF3179 domain-containing protein [Nitrospira sp.]
MYSREIDGQILTIAPSGWTYDNTFVLYDKESITLWYPERKGLKGIQGKYFGRMLLKISSEDIPWGKWQKKFPESKILK